jgi:hypothetical protein
MPRRLDRGQAMHGINCAARRSRRVSYNWAYSGVAIDGPACSQCLSGVSELEEAQPAFFSALRVSPILAVRCLGF